MFKEMSKSCLNKSQKKELINMVIHRKQHETNLILLHIGGKNIKAYQFVDFWGDTTLLELDYTQLMFKEMSNNEVVMYKEMSKK
jgi:hypothetical protein